MTATARPTRMQCMLAAGLAAAAELEALGCRIISVYCAAASDLPTLNIGDPGALLDHLDAQSIDTSSARFIQGGVVFRDCAVRWFIPRPQPQPADPPTVHRA